MRVRLGHRRRSLAVAACSLAFGVAALAVPASGAGAAAPHCKSAQLRLRFINFQGATGHRFFQMAFRNLGATCTLRGYSRVQLLAPNGHVITSAFTHETGFPVDTVTVRHGKRAFVAFTYLDGAFCSSGDFHAYRVRVFPAHDIIGFAFNPIPANRGPIFVCGGSEGVYPTTAKPGP